ncbi:hypothetical protein RCH05_004084 [Janthinobacterium sp. CAN_S7]
MTKDASYLQDATKCRLPAAKAILANLLAREVSSESYWSVARRFDAHCGQ